MIQISKRTPQLRFSEFKGDWELSRFEEAITLQRGFDLTKENSVEGDFPVYSSSGISYYHNDFKVAGPGIITGRKGQIGAVHYCEGPYWPHDTTLWVKDFHGNSVAFTYWFLNQFNFNKYEASSSVPTLNRNNIHPIKIFFPSLPEQQKIASFLSAVDKKIQLLQRKKELLEQYKKGVMLKIFSQEIRFKDEDGNDYPEWEEKHIGEIYTNRSEKGFNDLDLLSVTIQNGVVKRTEIEGKDNSSSDKSSYKLVKKNDIVYNSMRMWQGASGVSKYDGIVSPAYTILKGNSRNSSEYFGYLFKMRNIVFTFQRYSQGLTSDTWNLKYPQLAKIKVPVPSHSEQKVIATFLSCLDQKDNQLDVQLSQIKNFKTGLLQKMFV